MALATKCPHCNTIFRVAADQLKLRGGIVRCGSCALVFDGNAALVEPASKPTPVIPDVAAEAPPAKPAISEYVHGSPVDFEIDFDDTPAEAVAPQRAAVPPAAAAPAAAPPQPEAPAPAVWRSASAPAAAPVAEPAPVAPQPQAKAPTPDDIAIAAVSRAFAAATTHAAPASPAGVPLQAAEPARAATPSPAPAAAPPPTRAPATPAARSLIDVVSPDAAFTAAAEPSPPLVAEAPAAPSPAQARLPAGPSSLADLVAPDAIFSATSESPPPLAPPPAKASSPAGSAALPDMLSPDATFSATTETTPAAAPAPRATFTPTPPPAPAVPRVEEAAAPAPVAPAAATAPASWSTPADHDALLHRDDAAPEPAQAAEETAAPPEAAITLGTPTSVAHAISPADEEVPPHRDEPAPEPEQAAGEPALPPEAAFTFEAPAPVDHAVSPADEEVPPHLDQASTAPAQGAEEAAFPPDQAPAFEAPASVEHAVSPADEEVATHRDEAPAEPVPAAEESSRPSEAARVLDEPSSVDHAVAPADEEVPQKLDETSAEPAPAPSEPAAATGASLVDAIDQWSADNSHPDGRVEPSLDTPQEHLVVATLDDAHHFEDLPSDEQSAPDLPAAAEAGSEPWSLSEPDETALHAVAAVNTDAPDDGASVTEEEAVEPPAKSRRERALKRAKSRRDASGPAAEHEVFAIEENGPEQEASADEIAARMRAIAGVDEKGEAEDLDHSDLSFVKRVDRSQRYGKAVTITMAVGVPILLAGLVLQAATTFRDTLAANYPQLKPALTAVCQPLGCKIALPSQLDALSVEPGELASMTENTFSFSTVLRNQSKTPQAWPHVELTLNDNADKPVLRRVFAPHEYLPSPTEADKGFGPRSEQSIKLYFELKELKASGYHIAIFYP